MVIMINYLCQFTVLMALLIVASTPPRATGGDGATGVESLLAAHRGSRGMVETMSCRVNFAIQISDNKGSFTKQTCSSEFWLSAQAIRAKIIEGDETYDYTWKDSVRMGLHTRSGERGGVELSANKAGYANRHLHRCDAWSRGLFVLTLPGTIFEYPLEQLAAESQAPNRVERKTVDGRPIVAIVLVFPVSESPKRPEKWGVEVQLDPAVNYLVRKTIYTMTTATGAKYEREEEVIKFVEPLPGIYFPEKIVGHDGFDGKVRSTRETTISGIKINQPLPENIFQLRYPNGIYMTDSVTNTTYQIDADGRPTSGSAPLGTIPPPPAGKMEPTIAPTETTEEPASPTRWVLPISLAVLLAGIGLYVYRRLRSRSSE